MGVDGGKFRGRVSHTIGRRIAQALTQCPRSFARWTMLNQALSGLFCASLNFIDSTRTTRPKLSFEPAGNAANISPDRLYLLHGTLPREVVCTENLTPFLKLLPCKGRAGIASLLDGHKVFDASWQTMAIDFRSVCPADGTPCTIEIEQTIDMVLDTERAKRPRTNPIPRPVPNEALLCDLTKSYPEEDTCFPSDSSRGQSWTVAELFGRSLRDSCLAADAAGNPRESLCLYVPEDRTVHTAEGTIERRNEQSNERCYVLPETGTFDMILSHIGPQTFNNHTSPPIYASRSITGHGQERGGVQSRLTNPNTKDAITFVYFESLPWFMKPYLHTLVARLSNSTASSPHLIKDIYYRPALDRHRGTQLELVMTVPANSTVILTYDFDKAILRYTEYPPDANRGFDVAPAVIRLLTDQNSTTNEAQYIRTTSLLLPLPTPDFSMPYNVIILTSTVMALAFGSIFNFLVRRFVAADEVEGWNMAPLKARLRSRIEGIKSKVMKNGKVTNGTSELSEEEKKDQ